MARMSTLFLGVLLALLFSYCALHAQEPSGQPVQRNFDPRVILGDNAYFLGLFQKTYWHQAVHICAFLDMALLAIDSQAQNEALRKHLSDNGIRDVGYWLAGNDLVQQREFFWISNGHPFACSHWAPGEPSSNETNHCVSALPSFEWAVADCGAQLYFICSAPVQPWCGTTGSCRRRTSW